MSMRMQSRAVSITLAASVIFGATEVSARWAGHPSRPPKACSGIDPGFNPACRSGQGQVHICHNFFGKPYKTTRWPCPVS